MQPTSHPQRQQANLLRPSSAPSASRPTMQPATKSASKPVGQASSQSACKPRGQPANDAASHRISQPTTHSASLAVMPPLVFLSPTVTPIGIPSLSLLPVLPHFLLTCLHCSPMTNHPHPLHRQPQSMLPPTRRSALPSLLRLPHV